MTDLPSRDWSTVLGCEALARRIENYWKQKGRKVIVRSLHNHETGNGACHVNGQVAVVRSNMVGGWPPKDPTRSVYLGAATARRRGPFHAQVRA